MLHHRLRQLIASPAPAHTIPSPDRRWTACARVDPSTDRLDWEISPAQKTGDASSSADLLHDVFPCGIAWTPDSSGIFYDRTLPLSGGHGLYFHAVGTPQRQDRCVFYRADHPDWFYQPHVSPDGRWLAVAILNGSAANRLSLFRLDAPGSFDSAHEIALIDHFMGRYDVIHWQADRLILRSVTADAPNGRLLAVDLATGAQTVVLPEGHLPLLDAAPLKDGWVGICLFQGRAELFRYDAHGAPAGAIPLPGLGTVDWLETETPDTLRFAYTDYTHPPQIYRWRIGEDVPQPLEDPAQLSFDPTDFVIRAHTVLSKDGACVPIFLAHRRDCTCQDRPTLLTAYGGLGYALTPRFSADVLAWLETGGIYVSVCARGGSELGARWHQAAVGAHKQRTFDDVLSTARWLIDQGITSPPRLGLWGVSNGGLTAGACLTQAPDLFGAVIIEAGLLDMLNYHQLGQGWQWLSEYGHPDDPSQRRTLAAYSPLHNIQPGCHYPPTLIATHEDDPRVGAQHSLSFARALAEAQGADAPIRLHIHAGSGHGAPATGDERFNWIEARLAFLAQHLQVDG